MLRLDVSRLGQEGSVQVEARIPEDDALWHDTGLTFSEPVEVRLRASHAGTGEVVVRGTVEGTLHQECRRCLEPVPGTLSEELTMVFVPPETPGAEEDVDVRILDESAAELELGEAVREEVILAVDPYVVCNQECKGLCPQCGTNLNDGTCDCTTEEADPRWDALRALQEE